MNGLQSLSNDLALAVERAGRAVFAVNGRARLGSTGVHWRPGLVVTADHTVHVDEEVTRSASATSCWRWARARERAGGW